VAQARLLLDFYQRQLGGRLFVHATGPLAAPVRRWLALFRVIQKLCHAYDHIMRFQQLLLMVLFAYQLVTQTMAAAHRRAPAGYSSPVCNQLARSCLGAVCVLGSLIPSLLQDLDARLRPTLDACHALWPQVAGSAGLSAAR